MTLVLVYLAAIVAANVTVAQFGPVASLPIAFAWIGLDLTIRDRLHDRWHQDHLWPRMLALIVAGGVLSWLVNRDAGQIAVASTVAFVAAASADAVVYTLLGDRSRRLRVNGSNVVSSAVDSVVFPTLAFGGLLPWIVLGQFAAAGWTADGTGGHVMYRDRSGKLLPSMNDGHMVKPQPGWETVRTVKRRFINARAASSDAAGFQPDEGGPQPTPGLQLWDDVA